MHTFNSKIIGGKRHFTDEEGYLNEPMQFSQVSVKCSKAKKTYGSSVETMLKI